MDTAYEKNYITPSGLEKLREEFRILKYEERPKVVEVVAWAAGNGDRSENGDYIYGKKRLREIDKRLRFLNKRLDNAEVVDPRKVVSEQILFGATVTLLDDDGVEKIYTIVGIDETEVERGKISWKSPIARALFKARVGDYVTFQAPQGERGFEILEVCYKAID